MQQHLGRLEGVDRVEVTLLGGKVAILPKPDARLDPRRILKATYDSGVTVTEMTVTATGSLEKGAGGALELRVAGDQSYPIKPGPLAQEIAPLAGRTVTVRAFLYRKPAGKQSVKQVPAELALELVEIVRKP